MNSDSDQPAKMALTALCAAASQARADGGENGNDVATPKASRAQQQGRESSEEMLPARPALTVDLSKGGRSTPKAMSSMSVDFASEDEEDGSSISDSEFFSRNGKSGTAKPNSTVVVGSGGHSPSACASAKTNAGELKKKSGNTKSTGSRTAVKKKQRRPAHGSHASGKWRKSTASSKSVTRRMKKGKGGVGNGSDASDDDEGLSYAISKLPKPKRAMTAYNFFFQAERKKIIDMGLEAYEAMMAGQPPPDPKECSKEEVSFQLIGKTIGRWWKQISENDLKRYQALAKDDANRYKRERKIYNAEVASMKAGWIQQFKSVGKGKPSPLYQSRSIVTESDRQSSSNSSFEQGNGNDADILNDIIQSLTEEQVHLLYSLQNRRGQGQQQRNNSNSALLAPVIERLKSTLPLPSVVTANESPASAVGITSVPSGQVGFPDLASMYLLQSRQISELQNQVNVLNQHQNQHQHPPPMPLDVPQDFSRVQPLQHPLQNLQGNQQQQGIIHQLRPSLAHQQLQLKQLLASNQHQSQHHQQPLPSPPTNIQGVLFNNTNFRTILQQSTGNGTATLPLFGPGGILCNGQVASSVTTSNAHVEGGMDQMLASLINQLPPSNEAGGRTQR